MPRAARPSLLAAVAWLGSACGCVRWIGIPPLPTGSFNDTALYGVTNKKWGANVNRARKLMRQPEAGFDWRLAGTAGESLARFSEVREKFAGVIFVGDSQIREVSWAALKMLTPTEAIRYDEKDPVVGRKRASELGGSCVPQSVGKTGFTAECRAGVCRMHSPFHNKSHAEAMRKLLLTRPHDWDGSLSLTEAACSSDFFLSYQATWGAIPVKPLTLPRCMHPRTADDTFGVVGASGVRKPVLWVMDGGGLHEMEFCDARRWTLPQVVLKHFSPAVLRRTVVWQPAGGGFMMRSSRRYKGECAAIEPEMVSSLEIKYLDTLGVQHYDYPGLALQFAPLMFDAIHFTYYWVPCAQAFPEMARLVAQLALQHALGRPVQMCRTPEELAAPVDEAGALSFRVPLGRGGTELPTSSGAPYQLGKLAGGAVAGKTLGKAASRRATTKAAAKSKP